MGGDARPRAPWALRDWEYRLRAGGCAPPAPREAPGRGASPSSMRAALSAPRPPGGTTARSAAARRAGGRPRPRRARTCCPGARSSSRARRGRRSPPRRSCSRPPRARPARVAVQEVDRARDEPDRSSSRRAGRRDPDRQLARHHVGREGARGAPRAAPAAKRSQHRPGVARAPRRARPAAARSAPARSRPRKSPQRGRVDLEHRGARRCRPPARPDALRCRLPTSDGAPPPPPRRPPPRRAPRSPAPPRSPRPRTSGARSRPPPRAGPEPPVVARDPRVVGQYGRRARRATSLSVRRRDTRQRTPCSSTASDPSPFAAVSQSGAGPRRAPSRSAKLRARRHSFGSARRAPTTRRCFARVIAT